MREAVAALVCPPLPPGRVTFSAGVAAWDAGEDPESLLSRADQALYRAKENGRNRVEAARGRES